MTPFHLQGAFSDYLCSYHRSLPRERGDFWEAYRYALDGAGKRVRPMLVLLCNQALGGRVANALPAALAVEMIHTYSLIHDDLPCMDDDRLRRGRPTLHMAYDEATALLVGDALLTDAFHVLTTGIPDMPHSPRPDDALAMVRELSACSGGLGMVGGQAMDTYWTGRTGYSQQDLDGIHRRKTGHLIAASLALGGISAHADETTVRELHTCGERVGLAFQIIDDTLDETVGIGKTSGKDLAQGKLTYRAMMSRPEALARARQLTEEALAGFKRLAPKAEELQNYIAGLLERRI